MAKKFSQFPSASSISPGDSVVGLKDGENTRFSFATFLSAIQSLFVPTSRKVNNKALSSDISLNASDVGAVGTADVGVADGVASLDSNGKVPGTQLDLSGKQDTITASGIIKGDGQGGVSAATPGTDYQAPLTAGTDYATPAMIPTVPSAYTSNPAMDGTASPGSSGAWARGDHVHPSDTSRVPVYGLGKNLLDNWYFGNPVNQRGETSYSAPGGRNYYTIDRWFVYSAGTAVSVGSGSVTVGPRSGGASSLTQNLSIPFSDVAGKSMSVSCLLADGSFIAASNTLPATTPSSNRSLVSAYGPSGSSGYFARLGYNNRFYFMLQTPANTSFQVVAVKLELGTEQTLCHNEGTDANPVWVLNEIPNYEQELIRCQTSTADSSDTYANKSLATEQQLAYVETGTTASRTYAVGEYFCWNGLLYRVTSAISSGASFTPGTNCEQATVTTQLSKMYAENGEYSVSSGVLRFQGNSPVELGATVLASISRTESGIWNQYVVYPRILAQHDLAFYFRKATDGTNAPNGTYGLSFLIINP